MGWLRFRLAIAKGRVLLNKVGSRWLYSGDPIFPSLSETTLGTWDGIFKSSMASHAFFPTYIYMRHPHDFTYSHSKPVARLYCFAKFLSIGK